MRWIYPSNRKKPLPNINALLVLVTTAVWSTIISDHSAMWKNNNDSFKLWAKSKVQPGSAIEAKLAASAHQLVAQPILFCSCEAPTTCKRFNCFLWALSVGPPLLLYSNWNNFLSSSLLLLHAAPGLEARTVTLCSQPMAKQQHFCAILRRPPGGTVVTVIDSTCWHVQLNVLIATATQWIAQSGGAQCDPPTHY